MQVIKEESEKIAEIKNSLAIISGQAQIILSLKKKIILDNEGANRAREIIAQVDRINKLLPEISYHNAETK